MTERLDIAGASIGGGAPLLIIAGPCVLEDPDTALELALRLKQETSDLGLNYVFKASYDKANRTGASSFRGPGLEEGLRWLARVKSEADVPVLSDVHRVSEVAPAAEVLDIIQIPAFLCRQTDLIQAAARTGLAVNVKKGQFMAPWDMKHVTEKIRAAGGERIILTERGACHGYNNLVVDMRSFAIMRETGASVVFDATHSVQLPGGGEGCSGGDRRHIAPLARAATAAGVDGVFLEVHPDPDRAKCDGPNSLPLAEFAALAANLRDIDRLRPRDGEKR